MLGSLIHHEPTRHPNRWIAATYRNAAVLIVDTGRVASLAGAGAGDAVAHAVAGAFSVRGCPLEGLQPWGKDGCGIVYLLYTTRPRIRSFMPSHYLTTFRFF